jgi:hypothetical protein
MNDFMTANKSVALVVNGNENPLSPRPKSVTYLTSEFQDMVDKCHEPGSKVTLILWCDDQDLPDARKMVLTLLSQLFDGATVKLTLESIRPNRRPGFERLLRILLDCIVQQLKATMVYVLIDSISVCEGENRTPETMQLFRELLNLTGAHASEFDAPNRAGDHLKVMVTSSNHSEIVKEARELMNAKRQPALSKIEAPTILPKP